MLRILQFSSQMYFGKPKDNNQIIYFLHDDGYRSRSVDQGQTWTSCGNNGDRSSLAIDPRDANHLFLATQNDGIFISKDGCSSWSGSLASLDIHYANSILIDSVNPDIVYVGTAHGAYISFDSGLHWSEINDGLLGATVIYSMAVDSEDNIYATTPYGIFKLESK